MTIDCDLQTRRVFLLPRYASLIFLFVTVIVPVMVAKPLQAQERTALTDGKVVDFQRDIAPIFREHCLECHNEDDAKNDFRIDDPDSVFSYVEPEDLESSAMYIDYLLTDDPDYLMPPPKHGGPLSAGELALIRVWIQEGADWPEDAAVAVEEEGGSTEQEEEVEAKEPLSLVGRVWSFQGYLHPATVHFPIALFLFGAFFVVLGWKWPALGKQIPLACLLLGAPSALAATAMGWSFATEMGYGSWTKVDFDSEVFWHRWSGVIVTVASLLFAIVALKSLKNPSEKLDRVWKVGLLVIAGMVGAVGHQGGELVYGKNFYPDAFRILLGTDDLPEEVEAVTTEELQTPEGDDETEATG